MQPNDARILKGAAMIAAPVGLVATVVSAVVAGGRGLTGGLVALAVVAVFFGLGSWALMWITQDKPQVVMTAGMLVYTVQILLIGVFVIAFKDTTLFSGRAFALVLLFTALAWVGGQIRESLTARMLYVDPLPSVPGKSASASADGKSGTGKTAPAGEDSPSLKTGSSHGG
jgi:ATP synthase protein I